MPEVVGAHSIPKLPPATASICVPYVLLSYNYMSYYTYLLLLAPLRTRSTRSSGCAVLTRFARSQLGLQMQLSLTTDVLCWGAMLEISVGVFFGFKIGPISLGVNIHVAGTLNIAEMPAAAAEASSDESSESENVVQSDPGKCTNFKNPFRIITEVMRKLKSGSARDKMIADKINKAKNEILASDEYKGYTEYHDFKKNPLGFKPGEWTPKTQSYGNVAGKLRASFDTFSQSWNSIQRHVRTYAHQAVARLIDNTDMFGTDGCTLGCKKYTQSTGRFVARYIYGASDIKDEDPDKKDTTETPKDKKAAMQAKFDDRTLNFVKVARMSKFKKNPYFWREYGLSLSNMFLRIVGDIQAIFNAYFANDAEWDGVCSTLPGRFINTDQKEYNKDHPKKTLAKKDNKVKEGETMFGNHHYVSKDKAQESDKDTGKNTAKFFETTGLQEKDATDTMYPTAICESVNSMVAELLGKPVRPYDQLLGYSKERLTTVWGKINQTAFPILKKLNKVEPGVNPFFNTGADGGRARAGVKHGVTLFFPRACTTLLNEGKYDRLECEEPALSAVFVNTFPQLTKWILEEYVKIAALLKQFDKDLGEVKAPGGPVRERGYARGGARERGRTRTRHKQHCTALTL